MNRPKERRAKVFYSQHHRFLFQQYHSKSLPGKSPANRPGRPWQPSRVGCSSCFYGLRPREFPVRYEPPRPIVLHGTNSEIGARFLHSSQSTDLEGDRCSSSPSLKWHGLFLLLASASASRPAIPPISERSPFSLSSSRLSTPLVKDQCLLPTQRSAFLSHIGVRQHLLPPGEALEF